MTKLTLSVEADVVEQAKRLAAADGTSVSAMFSQFIRSMGGKRSRPQLGPLTRKASGLISIPDGVSERRLIEDALLEKHGLSAT